MKIGLCVHSAACTCVCVCVCVNVISLDFSQSTEFNKTWYKCCAIGGFLSTLLLYLKSIITTWWARELVRRQKRKRHILRYPETMLEKYAAFLLL
jgi:hypothetical protein